MFDVLLNCTSTKEAAVLIHNELVWFIHDHTGLIYDLCEDAMIFSIFNRAIYYKLWS